MIYEIRLATNVSSLKITAIGKLTLTQSGETFIPDYVFHLRSEQDLSAITCEADLFEFFVNHQDYEILTNVGVFDWFMGAYL